jgi:DNA processing protein
VSACDECVRRSWLIGRLSGHLERRRAERAAIRGVLALRDRALIDALGGALASEVAEQWEALDADAALKSWSAAGAVAICRCDPSYPDGLLDLPDPPAVLHAIGPDAETALAGTGECAIAIVGARRASHEGLSVARELGRGCAAAGLTVVSGMALGIDAAAHEGALDAGGATIAVLACGPEHAYPPRRARLHGQIGERGMLLSELPPGTTPYRWAFPARNRIIAALTGMTVVVEAAEHSGSLITTEIALELGRAVGAVPGPVGSWRSRGTNALLRDGAHVIRDARDVLDDLCGVGGEYARPPEPAVEGLPDHLRLVLDDILAGRPPAPLDTGVATGEGGTLEALAELELLGLVERRPDGRYAPASRWR